MLQLHKNRTMVCILVVILQVWQSWWESLGVGIVMGRSLILHRPHRRRWAWLEIAIPGSRDSRIPGSRKFFNPEIPGLSRTQSRDFGINKIYLFNGLFSTLKNNIVHLLIRCVSQSPVARREGAVVLGRWGGRADMRSYLKSQWLRGAQKYFRVSYICLCLGLAIYCRLC